MRGLRLLVTVVYALTFIAFAIPLSADVSGDSKTGASSVQIPSNTSPTDNINPGVLTTSNPPVTPPYFENVSDQDTFYICYGETIFDTLVVLDDDPEQVITITRSEAPGTFTTTPSVSPAYAYYEYTPNMEGSYSVTYTADDGEGGYDQLVRVYIIGEGETPIIITDYPDLTKCWRGMRIDFQLLYDEVLGGEPIEWNVLEGDATINPSSGLLSFFAYDDGLYCFKIEAVGICGADTADICLNTVDNDPPDIYGPDTTVYQCIPDEICFDIEAYDPDNDTLTIIMIDGPGVLTRLDNTHGQVCFIPEALDSADYRFIFEVADSCRGGVYKCAACPPGPLDTIIVTVVMDEMLALECPDDSAIFLCEETTIGFYVGGIPDDAQLTLTPAEARMNTARDTIYIDVTQTMQETIKLVVESVCGKDSCEVTLFAEMNEAPVVSLSDPGEDSDIFLCQPENICIDVLEFSDINDNIIDTIVSPEGAIFNPVAGTICFTPQESGEYLILLKAVDACDEEALASVTLNVTLNTPPGIFAPDSTIFMCELPQMPICIKDSVYDIDENITHTEVTGEGEYSYSNGYICFIPQDEGIFEFNTRVVDECGEEVNQKTLVEIILNKPPVISKPDDFTIFQCEQADTCFTVTFDDPDNNFVMASVSSTFPSSYNPQENKVCFTPDGSGVYEFEITAIDECTSIMETVVITVESGTSAVIDCPTEFPIFDTLCGAGRICYDLPITPDHAIITIDTDAENAEYVNGQICFDAGTTGTYELTVTAEAECGSDVCMLEFDVTVDEAPFVECPNDTTITICEPGNICLPVTILPEDADITIEPYGLYNNGKICFYTNASGIHEITVTAATECGEVSCTYIVDVHMNELPDVVEDVVTFFDCIPETEHKLTVTATDAESDDLTFFLLSPFGSINSESGEITFIPDTAGYYCFDVEVTDICGPATGTVCATIEFNSDPVVVSAPDTTVTTCVESEICFAVDITDADDNISAIEIVNYENAVYNEGIVCFVPSGSGKYRIATRATDECGAIDEDTTVVIVEIGDSFTLECPGNQSDFICEADTLCYPIGGIPAGAEVSVFPPSAWFDSETGSVCFYTNCSVEKDLKVVVEGECIKDSCIFTVDVTLNSAPLVIMAPDTSLVLCEPQEIGIPAAIGDVNSNVEMIVVSDGATYNIITGKVYFTPTESGIYEIITRAIDECQAYDDDTTIVTVSINAPPVVTMPDEADFFLCELTEVCIDQITVFDDNDAIIDYSVLPFGSYDPQTGKLCFTPLEAGTLKIILTATDHCGAEDSDTTLVTIDLNSAPVVVSAPDSSVTICGPTEICFPLTYNDIDGNIESIDISEDVSLIAEGPNQFSVCLSAEEGRDYLIITTVTDICGAEDSDTTVIAVTLNSAPEITTQADTSISLCTFEEICISVDDYGDLDNNVSGISPNIGVYDSQTETICFMPDTIGIYTIIATITDTCEAFGADTTLVTVTMGPIAEITCPESDDFFLCDPGEVSVDIQVEPTDAIITLPPGATYENGKLFYYATESGAFPVLVQASAECGDDECTVIFNIEMGVDAQLTCPNDTTVMLCEPIEICRSLGVVPPEAVVTVSDFAIYDNGVVCFTPDTAGHYVIDVSADAGCAPADCSFAVDVIFNTAPTVDAGDDGDYFQCVFEEICRKVTLTDIDNNLDYVTVTLQGTTNEVGSFNMDDSTVCFTPSGVGTYCLDITVYDECGETAVDDICFEITTGDVAEIDCPDGPLEYHLCTDEEICIQLDITPATAIVTASSGATYTNGELCIFADHEGLYNIRVIAEEVCGSDTCDVTINVIYDDYADINCPELPTSTSLCEPDSVFVPLIINPISADVIVTPIGIYDFDRHVLAFNADTSGHYELEVIAEAPCSKDTCLVEIDVTIIGIPEITCPDDIDTMICLQETSEICVPVTVVGTELNEVEVRPYGYFSNNEVCVPVTGPDTYNITVVAKTKCDSAKCSFDLTVRENLAPILTVPADTVRIPWCEDDEGTICIDGIFATDPENDDITMSLCSSEGQLEIISNDSGQVCFTPDTYDTTYSFCISAEDWCQEAMDTFFVNLYPSAVCSVCVVVSIETEACYNVGRPAPVDIKVQTNDQIAGFDLLIKYDETVLDLYAVTQGDAIDEWEQFTYRIGPPGGCGSCPNGIVHLVGIADINNTTHPPEEQLTPNGNLARLNFQIANNQSLGGMYIPLSFIWTDCTDNSFSDLSGTKQYVDLRVYDSYGYLKWEEFDEIHYPESSRPFYLGTPDSCMVGDKITPIRCVEFYDGYVCVIHPDDIDDRGDVNLNGIAYEIADAVVFTNFFIYGFDAFTVNLAGQTAASDVNADGISLSIADLVYLIRVITGDAEPIPKLNPYEQPVTLQTSIEDEELLLSMTTSHDVGAGLLIFEHEGINPDLINLVDAPPGMKIGHSVANGEIRILFYSMDKGVKYETGECDLLNISYTGDGTLKLVKAELAGYYGRTLKTEFSDILVPEEFVLSQNYPNPFNPSTTIEMALPKTGQWNLNIYNVAGQLVRRFIGENGAGKVSVFWDGCNERGYQVASGIYLYKAEFDEQSISKKMIMLK